MNLSLALRFNYPDGTESDTSMQALQIILGVLDFSLMTTDFLMTGICVALVLKDIREKKRLA